MDWESITGIVTNNLAIFAIFIYLITISFFLNDKPSIDSSLFYGLLIIGPLLISIFYSFSGNIFESATNILVSAKDNFSGATVLKILAAIAVLGTAEVVLRSDGGPAAGGAAEDVAGRGMAWRGATGRGIERVAGPGTNGPVEEPGAISGTGCG